MEVLRIQDNPALSQVYLMNKKESYYQIKPSKDALKIIEDRKSSLSSIFVFIVLHANKDNVSDSVVTMSCYRVGRETRPWAKDIHFNNEEKISILYEYGGSGETTDHDKESFCIITEFNSDYETLRSIASELNFLKTPKLSKSYLSDVAESLFKLTRKYWKDLKTMIIEDPGVQGAQPKILSEIEAQHQKTIEQLQQAFKQADLQAIRKLVYEDASVGPHEWVGPEYETLWEYCVTCMDDMLIEALLKQGANPDEKLEGFYGGTMLFAAIQAEDEVVFNLLQKYGADPNIRDNSGETPLHAALRYASSYIIEDLIEYGADIAIIDECGRDIIEFIAEECPNSKAKFFWALEKLITKYKENKEFSKIKLLSPTMSNLYQKHKKTVTFSENLAMLEEMIASDK